MGIVTQHKKMKSSMKDFFSKRKQIRYWNPATLLKRDSHTGVFM